MYLELSNERIYIKKSRVHFKIKFLNWSKLDDDENHGKRLIELYGISAIKFDEK